MNLTINPVNLNKKYYLNSEKKHVTNAKINSVCSNNYPIYFCASIYQNHKQSLYSQNSQKRQVNPSPRANQTTKPPSCTLSKQDYSKKIDEIITKYNLMVYPDDLEKILTRNIDTLKDYQICKLLGSAAFRAYLRILLYEKYPLKEEGELTQISDYLLKNIQTKIMNSLFDEDLICNLEDDKTNYFYAILGLIIKSGEEYGDENLKLFMDSFIKPIIKDNLGFIEDNKEEEFNKNFEEFGYNADELYIEIKENGKYCDCRIFYQERLIKQENKFAQSYKQAIELARSFILEKARQGRVFKDEIKVFDRPKKPEILSKQRTEELKRFCEDYDLKFSNLRLLNRAFSSRKHQDGTLISHQNSYEMLEFIGDSILGYTVRKILIDKYPYYSKGEIEEKYIELINNHNLSQISTKMQLPDHISRGGYVSKKNSADIFEALIGAIYLNFGMEKVYDFLDKNLNI